MKNLLLIAIVALLPLTACKKADKELDTEHIQIPMPIGGVKLENHGKETWFAYGALSGVAKYNANGATQSHLFEDGHFVHSANLNIQPAEDGYFYEGWLVKGSDSISTGHLTNPFGDVRHGLKYEAEQDYSGYLKVVITLEPDDGDPAPAEHVAEGLLKVTER